MPGDLPKGWVSARFRDAMRLEDRREPIDPAQTYKLLGVRWYGNGAFLREQRLGKGLSAQHIYRVNSGDVIYNRLFAWKGSFGLIGEDLSGCYVSNEFPLFAARLDRVDPQFLLQILQQPRTAERADAFSTGTTSISRNRLHEDDFLHFPLNLPPIVEQRSIAFVLGAIDDTIAKFEALCADLFVATEALTEALCLGIDPMTRERNVIGWRPSTIAAEMSSIQVGIVVKPASYYVGDGGILALRSLNIRENRIDLRNIVRISDQGHLLNRKSSLRPGDIVTVRTGEPGTTAVVPKDLGTLNCIDIIFSRPLPTLRSEYASFFLNSRVAKRQIAVLQGGLAQQHLNVGEMRRIKILVPPPSEQDRIVNILSEMWLRNDLERAALDRLKNVRTALAKELLSGRIRLPDSIICRHHDATAAAA